MITPALLERTYRKADAARWSVPLSAFEAALEAGVRRAFGDAAPSSRELERHFDALHLQDVALACACELGHDAAWEHFITEYRPSLYRAAAALDSRGGARELADSLYAELYGVRGNRPGRNSLFRYFHGRSSLATWLRAILAQRHVDGVRAGRRIEPLDENTADEAERPAVRPDADHARFVSVMAQALLAAIRQLSARDRLRLRSYYEQNLTLAQVGSITGEHEATVSRQLAKTRRALREDIDRQLRIDSQLNDQEVQRCWHSVVDDSGDLDLREMFSPANRKNPETESF
jgi:RNA polymerase sigma-70 factor, ECF subfamily